jgi:hypothetical protein
MRLVPITIVVPTYNRAHLLGRALRSIVEQREEGDEIVVVDDGSTDDTERVVASCSGVRYERVAHGGAGKARNAGVSMARHGMVGFLDSDDELIPGTLACKRALMSARPDVVFCFSNFSGQPVDGPLKAGCVIDWSHDFRDWSDILAPGVPLSNLAPQSCAFDPLVHVGSMYRALMTAGYVSVNTAMVNRSVAGDALVFPEDVPTYEDWECFGRLAGRGPCAFLAFDSAIQHGHQGSRLTDASALVRVRSRLTILERVWGRDPAFLARHGDEFARVCAAQRLLGAKLMLLAGRQADARAFLKDVPGGPLWARIARRVSVPALVFRMWKAARGGSA